MVTSKQVHRDLAHLAGLPSIQVGGVALCVMGDPNPTAACGAQFEYGNRPNIHLRLGRAVSRKEARVVLLHELVHAKMRERRSSFHDRAFRDALLKAGLEAWGGKPAVTGASSVKLIHAALIPYASAHRYWAGRFLRWIHRFQSWFPRNSMTSSAE